jgi:ABC-type lipoprotein release transport system permease subunit
MPVPVGWQESGNWAEGNGVNISVRAVAATRAATSAAARSLREELAAAAPSLPMLERRTLYQAQLDGFYRAEMLVPGQLASLGVVIALLLALVGVAGMVAEGVTQRTREIGIRVALGARAGDVLSAVSKECLQTTVAGLLLGLAAVIGLHRALAATLFGFMTLRLGASSLQPMLVVGIVAAVGAVTMGTTLVCARRALSIEPVDALRAE